MNQQVFETAANDEQQKAIFHSGGVLLSAGAGSGKTFVLVEHIAYLIWKHRQNNTIANNDDYIKDLKNYLSGIVLMTFTKKAAGELAIRLKGKMQKMVDSATTEEDKWLWQISKSCLDSMTVGTIDGFCFKLIAQGYFPGLPQEMNVVSEIESNEKIMALYDEWLSASFGHDFQNISGVDSYFVSHRSEFCDAFIKIFTTPELRLLWKSSDKQTMLSYEWSEFLEVVFGTAHPANMEKGIPSVPAGSKGAWVEKFNTLEQYFSSPRSWSLEEVLELSALFENNKTITTGPRTEGDVKDYFAKAKSLKETVKSVCDELRAYEQEGRQVLEQQVEHMLNAFRWIEKRYSQIPGYTFSDLEYYVAQGLEDVDARKNITSKYKYLIVDEFQDTSRIQFEIIKSIVDDDFGRLFCVGDEKQAIYGFRGGELQVFQDCKKAIPLNLSLANNYRSKGNIIEFNNILFDNLFHRGEGYQGVDPYPVEVVAQRCPLEERAGVGVLNKHASQIMIQEKEKVSESDFVEAEADEILKLILKEVSNNPSEEICVLYKGLKPSLSLMSGLISAEIGLRAQVKIPYPQDPMLALFSSLVEGLQFSKQRNIALVETPVIFFVEHLLGYLNVFSKDLAEKIEVFAENSSAIGLVPAFGNFLHECGIANSNHPGNMAEIERIAALASGDLESVLTLVGNLASKKYSIEFQSPGKGSVVIMTTHASKGLEFSHIILGGIHNNGRKIPARDVVGKLPGSFRWRAHLDQKKKHRSPQMIMEACIDNLKDFAESKRLFYVACTRAENRISWIDLSDSNGKQLKYSDNSWINGLRTFENTTDNEKLFSVLKSDMTASERALSKNISGVVSESVLPMFHLDPLGVTAYHSSGQPGLVLFPELSVTKLATITQCPRKFYLKHICKLEDEMEFDRKQVLEEDLIQDEIIVKPMASSAERGTLVHEAIAHAITHRGVISLAHQKDLGARESTAVKWATDKVLEEHSSLKVISEQPIKFDFFGQMVSGTPDLVLLPSKDEELIVVDFKTGAPGGDKESPYWFQLKCYAHAIQSTQLEHNFKNVKLELWYVDAQIVKTEQKTLEQINQELSREWSKLARPFRPVIEHCSKCSFGKICHP